MALSKIFREFGDVASAIEDAGGSIEDVTVPEDGLLSGEGARMELQVRLPFLDGTVPDGLDVDVDGAPADDDGSVLLSVAVSRPTDGARSQSADEDRVVATTGGADEASATDGGSRVAREINGDAVSTVDGSRTDEAAGDGEEPAYRDPDRLRAVYEEHDSFPAMTEALGVDVTPQTVRRHMIDHGIHEPRSGDGEARADDSEDPSEESADGAAVDVGAGDDGSADRERDGTANETDQAGPKPRGDGGADPATAGDRSLSEFGFPEEVTVEDVKEAVRGARTIREVGQRLDLPRERAFRLLNALDLVDLVSGRLETADRSISTEELDQRIRRATAAGD